MNPVATLLVVTIALPLVFAAALAFRPDRSAKGLALAGTTLSFLASLAVLGRFDWDNAERFQGVASVAWIDALGLKLSMGVDGVSMLLIALTTILGPVCVLASFTSIRERVKLYYGWLLIPG